MLRAACSDCRYGSYISQACSSTADTQCSACTRCVELEVEIQECVGGLDAICDSCKRCSFEDPALQDIGAACEITEKYYYWKNENCCRTSFEQDVSSNSCTTLFIQLCCVTLFYLHFISIVIVLLIRFHAMSWK